MTWICKGLGLRLNKAQAYKYVEIAGLFAADAYYRPGSSRIRIPGSGHEIAAISPDHVESPNVFPSAPYGARCYSWYSF